MRTVQPLLKTSVSPYNSAITEDVLDAHGGGGGGGGGLTADIRQCQQPNNENINR